MMKTRNVCGSSDHAMARRQFLGGVASGMVVGGLGLLTRPAFSAQLSKDQKRVIVVNMLGGLSQLESWDPKPGTATGGPFRAISTSVPGIHIGELLPQTAQQMHHLALVRAVNTHEDDHSKGSYLMATGRRQTPATDYPELGAVCSKALSPESLSLPGHIKITPGGGGGRGNDSAYLGPKFASVRLGNGNPPQNSTRPNDIAAAADEARQVFRRQVNSQFSLHRRTAMTDAYTQTYEQALSLMESRDVFDIAKEPEKDRDRYGQHDFGRHCLLARRLLENGIPFVQVAHSNYDTHSENFDFHLEQLGEFDQGFACLVADLAERGMLDSTLIVVLSEFGRSPHINQYYGRDHWSAAWSVCLGGAGIHRGAVYGKTNEDGTKIVDGQVDHGNLFHTYLRALGLDSTASFEVGGRQLPMADPMSSPIKELLT
ncbi:MAG: DUF1501 domain-containing protein [Pirellulales bacterium]|nr:DUF1501 domain-containing protein [Pirellulales bacterium]